VFIRTDLFLQTQGPLFAAGLKCFFTKTSSGVRHDFNPTNPPVFMPVRSNGTSGAVHPYRLCSEGPIDCVVRALSTV
jgi:hypothetical protein